MSKILLLGGCGYIGSVLYDSLRINHHVEIVDLEWFGKPIADRSSSKDYRNLVKGYVQEFDCVVLCAGHSSVPICNSDRYGAFQNNVVNWMGLVEKLRDDQKFLYMSSSCVYTNDSDTPSVETDVLYPPVDDLTITKQTIDHYASLYHSKRIYSLRLGSVNGSSPNLREDLMINCMVRRARNDRSVHVFNPDCYRPILSTHDLSRAIARIVEADGAPGVYNISSFSGKIGDIGKIVANLTSSSLTIEQGAGTYSFTMNTNKFCKEFDFEFEDGLQEVVYDLLARGKRPGKHRDEIPGGVYR